MAEIVAGFLGPALQVVKWVGAPIIRQFKYLCCFTTNINSLRHEAEKLDDVAKGLQDRVEREKENGQVIVPQVDTWLKNSDQIKGQTTTILVEVPNVKSGCLKLRARFSLSRRAKKIIDQMKELRGEFNFHAAISQAGPPPAREVVPLGKTYEFVSRKQIEEDTMTSLRSGDVRMIGICGMGGLGKTTMAKTIMNRVLEEHVFQEAVIAVVSQQVDKSKIQLEIAGQLDLNLKDETSEVVRVKKLHARLSGPNRILLVLDDVWQPLVLEDLGIPCDSKGCTILLTSRNTDAFRAMDVQKIYGMKVLSGQEAWFLFTKIVGTSVDNAELNSIAKEVVEECKGLPIALTIVGRALKDEEDASIWNDARRELGKSNPDIPNLIAEVYNPLKLSYDFLDSKDAKSLFLLCCLFPEDADIPLEKLSYFCIGIGIFEGIRNLEEARNRIRTLTKRLKSRSLLLDGRNEDHVRMHDVVRDVCIFIAEQEKYIGGNDCTWISTCQLPTGLEFPNLRLLFLIRNYDTMEEEFEFCNAFLEGVRYLSVLCIENYRSLTSLSHTTQSLTNLNTLVLSSCHKLNSLSVVGKLVNLEILICRGCDMIEELPPEMKGLNRLKLLELAKCSRLKRIGRGIISSLVGLEELKMLYSFRKWEAEDRGERENAGLKELEGLTNLRCLEIEIEDPALAAENMHLSSKMERFIIRLGVGLNFLHRGPNKLLYLLLEPEICLGHWIQKQLLRDTECLYLSGDGANNLDLAKSQNIRWLKLGGCQTMKNIGGATVLPSIKHLDLSSLPELEEIWDGPISLTSFQNLETLELNHLASLKQLWKSSQKKYVPPFFTNLSSIDISYCPHLRNLRQLSVAAGKDCLPQLQKLHIQRCEMMEQVFLWNEEDENKSNCESQHCHMIAKTFPKLQEFKLISLPNLGTFYQGIEDIEFPQLMQMVVKGCPKMTSIVSTDLNNSGGTSNVDIDHSSHLFCQASFGNLKKLRVECNPFCGHKIPVSLFNGLEQLTFSTLCGSVSLFSSSVAGNLVNLRVLNITRCNEMLKVIEDKEEEEKVVSGTSERAILFPKLEKLKLEDLPKLVSFCEWKCDVELPSLRELVIRGCPDMNSFSMGFIAAPNLEVFTTDVKNNLEIGVKVSFDCLKKLVIKENENPLYRHKFYLSLYNELKRLEVFKYQGCTSLFTSSITKIFVNLQELTICECDEMGKVIEDEEEEEKVASGGQRTLLFPSLQKLELKNLPKLVRFCEWKCDVELPSLTSVVMWRCPNMKSFSLGAITTPNMYRINSTYFGGTTDLNDALQQHLARKKKKQEEEERMKKRREEGGEEEHTRRG